MSWRLWNIRSQLLYLVLVVRFCRRGKVGGPPGVDLLVAALLEGIPLFVKG